MTVRTATEYNITACTCLLFVLWVVLFVVNFFELAVNHLQSSCTSSMLDYSTFHYRKLTLSVRQTIARIGIFRLVRQSKVRIAGSKCLKLRKLHRKPCY